MGKIVHVVLQKLAPTTEPSFTAEWAEKGNAMLGRCRACLLGSEDHDLDWEGGQTDRRCVIRYSIAPCDTTSTFTISPGKVPGLLEIKLGECLEGTKQRAAGFTHSESGSGCSTQERVEQV